MKKSFYLLIIGFAAVFSCSDKEKAEEVDLAVLEQTADSIAVASQNTLMANVKAKMEEGGPAHALEFCNVNAMPLTDSLSNAYNVKISRITGKTRNPSNGLKTDKDKEMYNLFAENSEVTAQLVEEGDGHIFYKRINIAMPTCLKCHGAPGTEIEPDLLDKLKELYPEDLAQGYAMNDFRGLWRIELDK